MDFPIRLTSELREHLRALRKARGLTQAALGALLGVRQARIAEIEANPGAVSIDQMIKLLSALHASMVLQDGTPAPGSPPSEAREGPPAAALVRPPSKRQPGARKPASPATGQTGRTSQTVVIKANDAKASSAANLEADRLPGAATRLTLHPKKGSW